MKQAGNTSKARKAATSKPRLSLERTRGVLALLRGLVGWLGLSQTKKDDRLDSSSPLKPGALAAKKRRVTSPKGTKRISHGRKAKG